MFVQSAVDRSMPVSLFLGLVLCCCASVCENRAFSGDGPKSARVQRPESTTASAEFSKWLGPQQNSERDCSFGLVVDHPIDPKEDRRLSKYKLALRILPGSKLELPKTSNPLVSFDGKKFKHAPKFKPDSDELYLLATIHLNVPLGWRIYTLNARVTAGPLKGAIVHFRDGEIQESIRDPCLAVYRIPKDIKVKPGNIPFEIVSFFAK